MAIHELQIRLDDVYTDPGFIQVIETHLEQLRTDKQTKVIPISDINDRRHVGDFYGLLTHLQVPAIYHYATLRLNGLTNTSDYSGVSETLTVPSYTYLEMLRQLYVTQNL